MPIYQTHPNLIVTLVVSLIAAVFFTTIRAAFTSTGRSGAERLLEKYPHARRRLTEWIPRWEILRLTIHIAATLTSLIAIAAFFLLFIRPNHVTTPLELVLIIFFSLFASILLFSILPRALSEGYSDRISITFIAFTAALSWPLWPIIWIVNFLEKRLRFHVARQSDIADRPTNKDTIRSLVNQPPEGNGLEEEERQIIRSVVDFGETVAREIMTPRVDVEALEDEATVTECAISLAQYRHSRCPVYQDNLDNIVGMVHLRDVLRLLNEHQGTQKIGQYARQVPFIPETMAIGDLLRLLREEQARLAIVVDEYGGTAGIVTLEDIFEQLVGGLYDEYDGIERDLNKLSDGSFVFNARVPIYEVNETAYLQMPEGEEYESLGGYIINKIGRIPRAGEKIEGEGCQITIQTANARQIQTVKIVVNGKASAE